MASPTTRYAKSGEVNIAYQVVGDGPLDLVFVPGWLSHLELAWEEPSSARLLRRLASFSRLILFDKRGTGLSDRVPLHELPTLEHAPPLSCSTPATPTGRATRRPPGHRPAPTTSRSPNSTNSVGVRRWASAPWHLR